MDDARVDKVAKSWGMQLTETPLLLNDAVATLQCMFHLGQRCSSKCHHVVFPHIGSQCYGSFEKNIQGSVAWVKTASLFCYACRSKTCLVCGPQRWSDDDMVPPGAFSMESIRFVVLGEIRNAWGVPTCLRSSNTSHGNNNSC
eukprot:gnl/MRDRNA2_/MRDRNA2_49207_c0_seq1.p1 gnl/MRDRNA2_/MRDRNA2_49207_c0~~gnl/MRDRNA2_/MRDRNA2_49207_c0_seq1.p1  ORF type:complete len:143 (+),score=11.45 gnl/MRDRNA2_/MRDRNA2_49207_c0_seq1:2-430(+)